MHFSSPMVLQLANGEKMFAKSSDISLGGIRVSMPICPTTRQATLIAVFFTGLERDHPHPLLRDPVSYQILGGREKRTNSGSGCSKRRASGVRRVPARLHRSATAAAIASASTTCSPPSSRGMSSSIYRA